MPQLFVEVPQNYSLKLRSTIPAGGGAAADVHGICTHACIHTRDTWENLSSRARKAETPVKPLVVKMAVELQKIQTPLMTSCQDGQSFLRCDFSIS